MQAEPMAQPTVFPVQTQVVGQTRVVPVQTISTGQPNQHAALVGAGIAQIIIRVICSLFNLGALIAASIAVTAINDLAEFYNENGAEYENAGSYRAAAGWLIFVASAAIIFHVIAVIILVLYMSATVKKNIKLFTAVNAIICVLFVVAFLIGGILNAVYASENGDLHFDLCFGFDSVEDDEFCRQLERVIAGEAASAALSFLSVMFFGVLVCVTLCTCIGTTSTSNSYYAQPQVGPAYQQTNMSAYPPPTTSQYVPPPGPSYPSAYTSQYPSLSAPAYPPTQHVSPSAPYNPTINQPSRIPPSAPLKPEGNAPTDLPSYETAVTANYTVPQPAPSGEPVEESKTAPVP